jgi:5-methylcytosine-specific restriction endonuclease McrA
MKNYPSKNGSLLNRAVLVLNSSYAPMTITTSKRAICLFFLDKVDVIETYTDLIHSPSKILPLPSIVKLKDYINYNSMNVVLSRKNILLRDKHQCQYCANKSNPLTIDHIIPKERGGSESWDNLVTACQKCNRKKGNRTPEEANMPLLKYPQKPNRIHYFQHFIQESQSSWKPYLFLEAF